MIRIGTSGFSYDDWRGNFYPEKLAKGRFLDHYSSHFDCVELNATFYQLPALKTLEGMVRRTPEGFTFVVKAHQALTHVRADAGKVLPSFREALKPFAGAGRLGAVLLQFPFSFRPSPEAQAYVGEMKAGLGDAVVVVEFRHKDWLVPTLREWLRKTGLSLCCVDEPRLPGLPPPLAEVTGPVGYVRFHGRNAEAWWGKGPVPAAGEYIGHGTQGGDPSARYRYLYNESELREWLPRIHAMEGKVKTVYALFNNHPDGYAIRNAREMKVLLSVE